jgi:hypothetical protein
LYFLQNEMGGTCGTYGGEEKSIQLKGRNHLVDLDTEGKDNYKVDLKEVVVWIN